MAGEATGSSATYAQLRNRGFLLIFLLNALMLRYVGGARRLGRCWRGFQPSPLPSGSRSTGIVLRRVGDDEVRRELLEVAAAYPVFHVADGDGAPD